MIQGIFLEGVQKSSGDIFRKIENKRIRFVKADEMTSRRWEQGKRGRGGGED